MDRWESRPISCAGGLVQDLDSLIQGTEFPGTAKTLQNFEPHPSGGYRRINGFTKYDTNTVPGTANNPVLGLKVAMGGVFAARKDNPATDNRIFFSTGTGWTQVSTTIRTGTPTKVRFEQYTQSTEVVIACDGINRAWKWNGTTETVLSTAGAPVNPRYAKLFKNRLVLAGYGNGQDKITLSAPNNDTDYTGASGAIELNIGSKVTGIGIFREQLIIFCESSIHKLAGSTSADFAIVDISDSIGCLSHDSIQEVGGDLVFLATDGIRSYAATERIADVEISLASRSIQPLVLDILANSFDADKFSSCAIRKKSQYRLFVNSTSLPEADNLGLIGRLQDAPTTPHGQYEWSTMRGIKPYCADSEYNNNKELAVIGHPTNGFVYQLESGNTFDGTNIVSIFRSPDLTFDDATIRKVFQKIDVYTEIEGDVDIDLRLILNRGEDGKIQPSIRKITKTGAVATYGTAVYDTSVYGAFIFPNFKNNLIGSGFFGAFEFTCDDACAPFRIESYQVTFSRKGRR